MMMATQGHESQKSSDLPEGPQSFSPFPHLPLEGSIRGLHIQNIDGGCVDLRKTSTIHPNDLPGFQSEWVVSPPWLSQSGKWRWVPSPSSSLPPIHPLTHRATHQPNPPKATKMLTSFTRLCWPYMLPTGQGNAVPIVTKQSSCGAQGLSL